MLATFVICFVALLLFGIALAVGQLFGRAPMAPKCNPGPCCRQNEQCRRRKMAASARD